MAKRTRDSSAFIRELTRQPGCTIGLIAILVQAVLFLGLPALNPTIDPYVWIVLWAGSFIMILFIIFIAVRRSHEKPDLPGLEEYSPLATEVVSGVIAFVFGLVVLFGLIAVEAAFGDPTGDLYYILEIVSALSPIATYPLARRFVKWVIQKRSNANR